MTNKEYYHIHSLEDKSNVSNIYSDKWKEGEILSVRVSEQFETNLSATSQRCQPHNYSIQITQLLTRGLCDRTTFESDFVNISIMLELKFPAALDIFAPEVRDIKNMQIVNDDRFMSIHKSAMKVFLEMLAMKNYSPNTAKNCRKNFGLQSLKTTLIYKHVSKEPLIETRSWLDKMLQTYTIESFGNSHHGKPLCAKFAEWVAYI